MKRQLVHITERFITERYITGAWLHDDVKDFCYVYLKENHHFYNVVAESRQCALSDE